VPLEEVATVNDLQEAAYNAGEHFVKLRDVSLQNKGVVTASQTLSARAWRERKRALAVEVAEHILAEKGPPAEQQAGGDGMPRDTGGAAGSGVVRNAVQGEQSAEAAGAKVVDGEVKSPEEPRAAKQEKKPDGEGARRSESPEEKQPDDERAKDRTNTEEAPDYDEDTKGEEGRRDTLLDRARALRQAGLSRLRGRSKKDKPQEGKKDKPRGKDEPAEEVLDSPPKKQEILLV
jgi:hypothetical protein